MFCGHFFPLFDSLALLPLDSDQAEEYNESSVIISQSASIASILVSSYCTKAGFLEEMMMSSSFLSSHIDKGFAM